MEKVTLIQISERAEPAEAGAEEDNPGDVAEKQIAQPAPLSVFAREPNGSDDWCESHPAEPSLVEWRETGGAKQSVQNGRKPRQEAKCFPIADSAAPPPPPLVLA